MSYSHAPAAPTSCCCSLFGPRRSKWPCNKELWGAYVDDDHLSESSEHETMFGEMGFVKREASIGDFVEGAGFCDKIIPLPMQQPHCTLEEAMRRR